MLLSNTVQAAADRLLSVNACCLLLVLPTAGACACACSVVQYGGSVEGTAALLTLLVSVSQTCEAVQQNTWSTWSLVLVDFCCMLFASGRSVTIMTARLRSLLAAPAL